MLHLPQFFAPILLGLQAAFPDPLITDLPRFPATVAYINWQYSCAYIINLRTRREHYPHLEDEIDRVLTVTRRLERCWDAIDDAARPDFSLCRRREGLARLRGLIGEADYAAGRMPPPVPVWLMPRLDD